MSALSENTIKQITLGYLKSFYRNRSRSQQHLTVTGMDMRGDGGIVADGFIRFGQDDGTFFNATFEATSHETRDEILYRPRYFHSFWDALVVVSMLIPVLFALAHINGFYLLVADTNEAFFHRLFYLHAGILAIALFFVAVFRRLPRYRNIYAVEQFKQYHADEQWIAYGYDVFDGMKEKYKKELVEQCTRYGFGLIEITPQRKPKLIIAPSRAENFVPKQAFLDLLPNAEWQDAIRSATVGSWKKIKTWLQSKLKKPQNDYFKWFPRTYYNQWALILLGISASFFFIRMEYQMLPFDCPNERDYKTSLIENRKDAKKETTYYKVDAPVPGYYDSLFAPYDLHLNEEQFEEIIQTATFTHIDSINDPVRIVSSVQGEDAALYYDCERFHGIKQDFYLLVDTVFDNLSLARERMDELNQKNLMATAVWSPCLGGEGRGFLLYVDELILDSLEATQVRDSLQLQLDSLDRNLKILYFNPI